MPTLDDAIVDFARRHSWPLAKARTEAESQIETAVERALAGDLTAFDQLRELEPIARDRYAQRFAAGEGAPSIAVFSGTTGTRR